MQASPKYANYGDACMDLRAYLPKDTEEGSTTYGEQLSKIIIPPNGKAAVGTGLKFSFSDKYYMSIKPRGSMGIKKGLMLQNTEGVLDSNYRGECILFLKNLSDEPVVIEHNERIAQFCLIPVPTMVIEEVNELDETSRGEGRVGSSGNF